MEKHRYPFISFVIQVSLFSIIVQAIWEIGKKWSFENCKEKNGK